MITERCPWCGERESVTRDEPVTCWLCGFTWEEHADGRIEVMA